MTEIGLRRRLTDILRAGDNLHDTVDHIIDLLDDFDPTLVRRMEEQMNPAHRNARPTKAKKR